MEVPFLDLKTQNSYLKNEILPFEEKYHSLNIIFNISEIAKRKPHYQRN